MSGVTLDDASSSHHHPATSPPAQPPWERRLIGRVTSVPAAWARAALQQLIVASWVWIALTTDVPTWWPFAAVALAVVAEAFCTWIVVDAYHYRRGPHAAASHDDTAAPHGGQPVA